MRRLDALLLGLSDRLALWVWSRTGIPHRDQLFALAVLNTTISILHEWVLDHRLSPIALFMIAVGMTLILGISHVLRPQMASFRVWALPRAVRYFNLLGLAFSFTFTPLSMLAGVETVQLGTITMLDGSTFILLFYLAFAVVPRKPPRRDDPVEAPMRASLAGAA